MVAVVAAGMIVVACSTAPATAPATAPVVPEGFGVVPALVTPPGGGAPCEVCLWVADTHDLRRRGLMGVTDLGGRDGMAFVYSEPRTTNFTMRDTRLPLSIAFYDVDGRYLDAFDMEPCRAEPCTSYRTPAGFTVAVEVPRGELGRFQMVPGSRLDLVPLADHCDTPSSH
jgi:uncharacterized protein